MKEQKSGLSSGSASITMSYSGSSSQVPTNMEVDDTNTPQLGLEDDLMKEDDQMPEWMRVMLSTRFWKTCINHVDMNRAEECMFCLHCYKLGCPRCTHNEPGHQLLKIRRYVYRSVVRVKDMQDLNIDVSRVQSYIINGENVVHLRPTKRSALFRPKAGQPKCLTCGCWILSKPHLFCSLVCERNVDISSDDYSGPEAEQRYRSLQTNMLQDVPPNQHPAKPSNVAPTPNQHIQQPPHAAPPPKNGSFRLRLRKQANPERAPFF